MLFFLLFIQKIFTRSRMLNTKLWLKILVVFIILYFAATVVFTAFAARIVILDYYQKYDPIVCLNRVLFYYLAADLVLRIFLMKGYLINSHSYLTLPIRKSLVVTLTLWGRMMTWFNAIPVLFFGSLSIFMYHSFSSPIHGFHWIFIALIAIIINFLLALSIQLYSQFYCFLQIGAVGIVVAIIGIQYFRILPHETIITGLLMKGVAGIGMVSVVAFLLFYIVYKKLREMIYYETIINYFNPGWSFSFSLNKQSRILDLIILDLRLINRNRKIRPIIRLYFVCCLFTFFCFNVLYQYTKSFQMFILELCIQYLIMYSYGSQLLGWHSKNFDFLLLKPNLIREFIHSKYILFTAIAVISMLLTFPYFRITPFGILIFISVTLYCIGCLIFITLYFSTFNPKKMDANKSMAFNYEGFGLPQFSSNIICILIPTLIYIPFNLLNHQEIAFIIIGMIGLIGIIGYKPLGEMISVRIAREKYKTLQEFRR